MNIALQHSMSRTDDVGFHKNLERNRLMAFKYILYWHSFGPDEHRKGLRFVTSILFIFVVGVFMSSWLGASVLSLREWFIKRMRFVHHIYNASKQMGAAISSDQKTRSF